MQPFRLFSASEQVAEHIREGIRHGAWETELPGVRHIASELGVNHKTVEAALTQLEDEGYLINQGPRRRRLISSTGASSDSRPLRIAILIYEEADRQVDFMVKIFHELAEAGHLPFYPTKSLVDIGMNIRRLSSLVRSTEADAWLVCAGSREVIAWFAEQPFPAFALFGRWGTANIAGIGPKKTPAYIEAVRSLVALGHTRIVMIARANRRLPKPGAPEQAFLDTLQEEGISVGDYHFPHWENNKEAFYEKLETLFKFTPPTALIIQEALLFGAVQQFLANKQLRVPEDVSLVCADPHPDFAWRSPSIAHIDLDSRPWVRHILRWAAKVSLGQEYFRQISTKAQFISGGSIGPVNRNR
ncbi:MAG: substrate-binding domain-containing protein [Haloferula sp.]